MSKKLIVIDLDGTALADENTLHPHTKKVLKAAVKQGHIVCIATGRPRRSAIKFYKELGLNTIMANYNGSYVSNPKDPNYDGVIHTIPKSIINEILTNPVVAKSLKDAMCEYKDTIYAYDYTKVFMQWFHSDGADKVIGDIVNTSTSDVNSCLLLLEDEKAIKEVQKIADKHKSIIVRSWSVQPDEPKIVEVNPTDGNKGEALLEMANFYSIPLEDTYCFGDMSNDIEMLKVCPNSVAMRNAKDEIKALAKYVTERPNDEGGVGHWIEMNILKEGN